MIVIIMLGLFSLGLYVATYDFMAELYGEIREAIMKFYEALKEDSYLEKKRDSRQDPIWEHLRIMLKLTIGLGSDRAVNIFAIFTGLLGAGMLLIMSGRMSSSMVLIATLAVMILPYGILVLRLNKLRITGSQEGEILLTELLDNYKINFFNMQKAIEVTALTIEDAHVSKELLFNLSKGINRNGTEKGIRRYLREFQLSLNTSWGNILVHNMEFALISGIEVTEALSDLADTITKARKVTEYAKREGNEAKLILKYLFPAAYGLTLLGAIKYFDLTWAEFFRYQFETEVGVTWFTISLILYAAGLLLKEFLSKSKLDF